MKRLLLLLALCLVPSVASAQCSGVFGANTLCGSITGGPPTQIPVGSATGFTPGPTPPVLSTTASADWIWGTSTDRTSALAEAGIWPGAMVWTGLTVAKSFNASNNSPTGFPPVANGPNIGLFSYTKNSGSNNDVVSIIGDANAAATNTAVFGANFIARSNGGGLTGVKLVGLEVDVEPAIGDTVAASSGGLYLNAFTTTIPVGIQLGGVAGGKWTNGIIINNIAAGGAAIGVSSGASMNVGLDLTQGTYATSSIAAPGFTVAGTGFAGWTTATKFFSNVNSSDGFNMTTTGGNNPGWKMWDATNGGWTAFSTSGPTFNLATLNSSGSFVNTQLTITSAGLATFNNAIGIGTSAITSTWNKIAAGTTAKSQLNLTSGVAPSSPNDGDIFYIGTSQWQVRDNATTRNIVLDTATQTLTNKSISGAQINSGNIPDAQMPSGAWSSFTPTYSCGTATFTNTSSTAKTWGKATFVQIDLTITAIGTCTTPITFTLPNTSQAAGSIVGVEMANSDVAVICRVAAGSATATCKRNAGANFVVNDHVVASGVYTNQ